MEAIKRLMRSRWLLVVAGIWIQCTGGSSYNFGLYSQEIKTRLHYNQKTLDTIAFYKDIGANVGVISGVLCNVLPPWCVIAIGVVQTSFGYVMMWLASEHKIPFPANWQMCLYMLIAANGQTYFNTAVVVTCVETFPLSRGIIVGLMKGFVGLSGAILAQIYHALYEDKRGAHYLLMVSWLPAMVSLSLMLIIYPRSTLEYPNEMLILNRFSAVALTLAAYLAGVIILEDVAEVSKPLSTTACIIMLLILITPLATIVISELKSDQFIQKNVPNTVNSESIGSSEAFFLSQEEDDIAQDGHPFKQGSQMHSPLLAGGSDNIYNSVSTDSLFCENSISDGKVSSLTKNENQVEKSLEYNAGEIGTLRTSLLSANFWLLFATTACGMGSGLTAINNVSQLGSSLGYSQLNITTFVSLLSIWNFLGRFGAGFVSEYFLHSKGTPRPTFIAITLAAMCLGHLIIASAQPGSLYIGLVIVGIGYGSQWSLMPATTSEIFGLRYFGTLFNTIAIASPVGSYLLSVRLAGYIYDRETRKEHGDHATMQLKSPLTKLFNQGEQSCHGAHCFRLTFIIMAIVCLCGSAIATILIARTKDYYKEIFKQVHDQRKERRFDTHVNKVP